MPRTPARPPPRGASTHSWRDWCDTHTLKKICPAVCKHAFAARGRSQSKAGRASKRQRLPPPAPRSLHSLSEGLIYGATPAFSAGSGRGQPSPAFPRRLAVPGGAPRPEEPPLTLAGLGDLLRGALLGLQQLLDALRLAGHGALGRDGPPQLLPAPRCSGAPASPRTRNGLSWGGGQVTVGPSRAARAGGVAFPRMRASPVRGRGGRPVSERLHGAMYLIHDLGVVVFNTNILNMFCCGRKKKRRPVRYRKYFRFASSYPNGFPSTALLDGHVLIGFACLGVVSLWFPSTFRWHGRLYACVLARARLYPPVGFPFSAHAPVVRARLEVTVGLSYCIESLSMVSPLLLMGGGGRERDMEA